MFHAKADPTWLTGLLLGVRCPTAQLTTVQLLTTCLLFFGCVLFAQSAPKKLLEDEEGSGPEGAGEAPQGKLPALCVCCTRVTPRAPCMKK
jgi:hypothetical protein